MLHAVTSLVGLAALLLAALPAPDASAQARAQVVVSTGDAGGSYHRIGARLRTAVEAEGVRGQVLASAGSLENLARLDDPGSPVNVALTQSDALNLYLEDHPDLADDLLTLADVGAECAIFVVAAGSPIRSVADLERGAGGGLAIGDPGSGAVFTYENMARLDPRLRNTPRVAVDLMEALLQLQLDRPDGEVRAALFVQRPQAPSAPVRILLEHRDAYRLLPIREADLPNPTIPDGSPVYAFEKIHLGGADAGKELTVETLCTRGLMLGSKSKLGSLRGLLSKLMLESGPRIVGD